MDWTATEVEALAPDAASLSAARKLARPAPWSELGRNERALWGRCRGTRTYEVQVDLAGPAYTCSCPSRKVPCKHALALLLMLGDVAVGEPPAWVAEARSPRAAEPVRDPEAAARRAAGREARVAAGVEDLRLWLRDAVRGGLGAPRLHGWEEWDGFAARMIDAQAPGAASRLRSLGGIAAGRPDGWPERLLSGLAMLHLLCEGFERADGPLRDDVRTLLGFNAAKEDVLAGPLVRDEWLVVGRVVLEQERLRVQRTWLWGTREQRPALLLDFAPLGGTLEPRPGVGATLGAELAFYPGATPVRALVARSAPAEGAAGSLPGAGGIEAALAAAARALAANPWLDEWPVALVAVPEVRGPAWTLSADGSVALGGPDAARWRLLALSGGRPVSVFGVWNARALTPLSAGDGTRTVGL